MKIQVNDARFRSRLLAGIERGAKQIGVLTRDGIRRSINTSNADGTNPSKPGEPPHKVTQTLSKSIAEVTKRLKNSVAVQVGSNVPYARTLEYGTSKMAARPFLRPEFEHMKKRALDVIKAEVRKK